MRQVDLLETDAFIQSIDFSDFIFIEPQRLQFSAVIEALDAADAAIYEGEHLESFEAVEDAHMPEIFEDQFDNLNFIHFLPDVILEAIHPFLSRSKSYNDIHEDTITLPNLILLCASRLHSNYISI